MAEPTMSDQGFIDNIVGPIKDGLDKLKDAIGTPPAVPPSTPPIVVAPNPGSSNDLATWVRWFVLLAISLLGWFSNGKKDPIVIPVPPMGQVQSAPADCPCVKGAK